eukprot:1370356-Pyramimonas_sp.AAC.1
MPRLIAWDFHTEEWTLKRDAGTRAASHSPSRSDVASGLVSKEAFVGGATKTVYTFAWVGAHGARSAWANARRGNSGLGGRQKRELDV